MQTEQVKTKDIIVPLIPGAGDDVVRSHIERAGLSALECALRLKDAMPEYRVCVIAAESAEARGCVTDAVFRGADSGIVVRCPSDGNRTGMAGAFAGEILKTGLPAAVICCSGQSGYGSSFSAVALASALGTVLEDHVREISPAADGALCMHRMTGGAELLSVAAAASVIEIENDGLRCRPRNVRRMFSRRTLDISVPEAGPLTMSEHGGASVRPSGNRAAEKQAPRVCGCAPEEIRNLLTELGLVGVHPSAAERYGTSSSAGFENASVVIAGGWGMGNRENFGLLFRLAELTGAAVGATRAATDAGFTETFRMIGQTGCTVHPLLYIACGISGQSQHMCGIDGSPIILSINADPSAPLNAVADYVIAGRVEDALPEIIRQMQKTVE